MRMALHGILSSQTSLQWAIGAHNHILMQKGQPQGSRIDVVSHAIHRQGLARHHARMV
jgi:hypothetical protein